MKRARPAWKLRHHLAAMLMLTMLLTFAVAGGAMLLYRLPQIQRQTQQTLQRESTAIGERLALMLQASQVRLELLDTVQAQAGAEEGDALLDRFLDGKRAFSAIYSLTADAHVLSVGLPAAARYQRRDLLGSDLSNTPLLHALSPQVPVVWSGRHLSPQSAQRSVGVARRGANGRVLIAEWPLSSLVDTVAVAAGHSHAAIWIVDRNGEVLAQSGPADADSPRNIRDWPWMQAVLRGSVAPTEFRYGQHLFHAAMSHSEALDWYIVGRAPKGLRNPQVQRLLATVLGAFVGCLLIGLVVAPHWAKRLARPLQHIAARARQSLQDQTDARVWPRGAVAELNALSSELEAMTQVLRERDQKSLAIFNAAPVPMSVIDESQDVRFLDVNAAWCQEMLRARDDVVGRSFADLGLLSLEKRDYREIVPMDAENMEGEVWLPRGDGEPVQLQAYGRRIRAKNLAVWAWVDIGPLRSVERALRVLNSDLEARVAERSDSLAASNAELSATAERLRLAQAELVRSEKMAALGGLVAGVAHELNTPIGNGVMAVSTLTSVVQRFRQAMQAGVRRADLTQLIEAVEQGCNMAGRNLRRAADLVHSFKQVAVDQTSAQRRSFELSEVVHEMVASLKPSFARQPWRIDVEVPASGLRLDSYPGALGQVLANLIQNAVLHGFEGREHGTVCITAGREPGRDGDAGLWLRVADNGRGIAAEHIDRIFDPFMTTRMGRGGTGLGLHISYNAVVNLLGGTLVVQSAQGEGACFELRLPLQAPRAPSEPRAPADLQLRKDAA